MAHSGDNNLGAYLNTADFWGGAGAVWEVWLDQRFSDKKQRDDDANEFDEQVVRLAEFMKQTGWDSPRVRQVRGYKSARKNP
jgi:hypothetical protein